MNNSPPCISLVTGDGHDGYSLRIMRLDGGETQIAEIKWVPIARGAVVPDAANIPIFSYELPVFCDRLLAVYNEFAVHPACTPNDIPNEFLPERQMLLKIIDRLVDGLVRRLDD